MMIKGYYSPHKETVHNFVWRGLQVAGQQGLIFLIFIISAKLLIPYDFGIYNYTLAVVFFLILFGEFGISTATSKYVAEYNVTDKNKLKAVLFNSGLIILCLTVVVAVLALLIGPWYLKDKFHYVLYLLPLVFLSPMVSLYDGIYRGLKKFKSLAIISLSVGVPSLIFVYLLISSYGLVGALLSQILFYALLLLALALGYKEFHFKVNTRVMKEIGKYSFAYGLAILGNYLFIRFGVLILGYYDYIEQIAVYELINKVFMFLVFPFNLLGQVVAPNFSALTAKGEYEKIRSKSVKYTLFFFVIGILLGVVFYFVLPLVFKAFFFEYSSKSYFDMTFLLCLVIYISNVWAATFDAGILVPTGRAGLMARFYLVLGVLGAAASLIAVRYFGFIGVMTSLAIASVVMAVGLRIFYFMERADHSL